MLEAYTPDGYGSATTADRSGGASGGRAAFDVSAAITNSPPAATSSRICGRGKLRHSNAAFARAGLDGQDLPSALMFYGKTDRRRDAANVAHAEYLKLLRSAADASSSISSRGRRALSRGQAARANRVGSTTGRSSPSRSRANWRIHCAESFTLHWSKDEWHHVHDSHSLHTAVGLYFVDIDVTTARPRARAFTFHWDSRGQWEGRDYAVELRES